jgi:hypothetical protein
MIGAALLALIFGALIASIWGQKTAQSCFKTAGAAVVWLAVIVFCIVQPTIGFPLLFLYGAFQFLLVALMSADYLKGRAQARRGQPRKSPDTGVASPSSARSAFRVYPRRKTGQQPAMSDGDFWATSITTKSGTRYSLHDRLSGAITTVPSDAFFRDWSRSKDEARPTVVVPPAATVKGFCTNCGGPFSLNDKFCAACGKARAVGHEVAS